jgi:hypothetical protein
MYTMIPATYKGWLILAPNREELAHVVFEYEANKLLAHLNRNHKENT